MYEYIGKVNENVDWGKIEESLNQAFSDLSEDILITAKPMYYRWANNWPEFVSSVSSYKDRLNKNQLNNYANEVFLFCDDPESLEKAIGWSKFLLDGEHKQDISFLSTYADLLYKTGKKDKAIKTMEEALALSGAKENHLTETLDKMKSGKKTW
jgi:tetratricopeptide (TPR) repeat protein